jgi:hypothetical protein
MENLGFIFDFKPTLKMYTDFVFPNAIDVRASLEPHKTEPIQNIGVDTELDYEVYSEDDIVEFPFKDILKSSWKCIWRKSWDSK